MAVTGIGLLYSVYRIRKSASVGKPDFAELFDDARARPWRAWAERAERLGDRARQVFAVRQQLQRGLLLHDVTFFELWETAMVMEPRTAALAAVHPMDSDIAALEANVRATEASLNDPRALTLLDIEFHALVARGVHNRVWQLTREPMARLFYPAFEAVMTHVPESGSRLLKAHRSVVAALTSGDATASAEWMEKHIRDFKRGFERAGLT